MVMSANTTALIALLERAGYSSTTVPLLQRADVFLDLSGEDIRQRLFLTQDGAGEELCLRPEFTIPLCLEQVKERQASGDSTKISAALSYCGPVFRQRIGESGEFIQAGVESLGRQDKEAADAEILGLAMDAAKLLGQAKPNIRMGDAGLINGVFESLAVPPAMVRRLKRRLGAGQSVKQALTPSPASARGTVHYDGVMTALEGAQANTAKAFVGDMLTISGARAAGGRSAEEIAERFLRKAQQGNADLDESRITILDAFLSLTGHPDRVAEHIRTLMKQHKLDIHGPLERYESRLGFLAARGLDLSSLTTATGFVRNLDYYTGMVFEITPQATLSSKPLIGGGRYDGLLKRLGAGQDVPAVGFAIWTERFSQNLANPITTGARA